MKRRQKISILLILLAAASLAYAFYHHRPFSHRMAGYVTDLKGRTPAQRENILRAGAYLNGTVLKPNQVFSLNGRIGPFTEDKGYLPERSFQGTELTLSPGGGVCQLASTLYNAALAAGFPILERVPHSQEVASVPRGRDATLAYAWADLKFKNHQPYPVVIEARELNEQLLVSIWGKENRHE